MSLVRFWGNRNPALIDIHDGLVVAGLGKMVALGKRDPQHFLKFADRVTLTVIDEAHQAIAPTYADVLNTLHTKRPRSKLLGLTATPGRSWSEIKEDLVLSKYFDKRKVTLRIEGYDDPVTFLIKEGYLAKAVFRQLNSYARVALSKRDIDRVSSESEVPQDILDRLGDDAQRNASIIHEIKKLTTRPNNKRIIVFAASVQHARLLATVINLIGFTAYVITSNTRASDREQIIRRFKGTASKIMVLVNYGVLTTGFDAPATSAAIYC